MIFLDKFSELMNLVFGLLECDKLLQHVQFSDPPLKILWQFFSKCLTFLFSRGVCYNKFILFEVSMIENVPESKWGQSVNSQIKGYLQVHFPVNYSTFPLRNALKSVRTYSHRVCLDAIFQLSITAIVTLSE